MLRTPDRERFLLRHVPRWAEVSQDFTSVFLLLLFPQLVFIWGDETWTCVSVFPSNCLCLIVPKMRMRLEAGAVRATVRVEASLGVCVLRRGVSSTEFGDLETLCQAVMKEKQPFERLEVSKDTLLKMFKVRGGANIPSSSGQKE